VLLKSSFDPGDEKRHRVLCRKKEEIKTERNK
jgi:hypothetical protein